MQAQRRLLHRLSAIFLCLTGLTWTTLSLAAPNESNTLASPGLIVILVDSLDPLEAAADPVWRSLTAQSAYGLMNTRVGGRTNPASTHLTLGSGVRADAPLDAGQAYAVTDILHDRTAGELYTSFTTIKATPGSIVLLPINQVFQSNFDKRLNVPVGWLGDQLQAAGAKVAVIGNSDTFNQPRRFGALLAMNSDGIVPHGVVGKQLLRTDPSFPYGLRSDYDAIGKAVAANADADLIVLELGDLARLDAYHDELTPAAYSAQRRRALHDIAIYITRLVQSTQMQHKPVLIFSATPRFDRIAAGKWLTPVWLMDTGINPALLHSRGTRRPGIILSTEMAAAIMAMSTTGSTDILRQTKNSQPVAHMNKEYVKLLALHTLRTPVLKTYVVFSIGVFLATWLVLWGAAKGALSRRHINLWNLALLTVAAFPLAALLSPMFAQITLSTTLLLITGLTLGIVAVAYGICRNGTTAFLAVFTATATALLVDILRGAPLINWSVLGYDVIGGARFYGIGNEYAGVLLTSVIMAIGIMLHRRHSRQRVLLANVVLALTTIIVGAPWLGANNGGAAAAVLGYVFTLFFLLGKPLGWRRLLFATILLIAAGAAAVALDLLLRPTDPSHLGQLAQQVFEQGAQPIFEIAGRKLAMNWKLLRYTIWTKVLVISLVMTLALLARPLPSLKRYIDQAAMLQAAAKGALFTALFLLLFNDSGVVAAATAMIPVTTFLLFVAACAMTSKWPDDQEKNSSDAGRPWAADTLK